MLRRHATPARNVNSILKAGLLTARSKGKTPAVWLCSAARSFWALLHVVRRHGGRVETTVVLEVNVPRSWLRRSRNKGLWCCTRDVPPQRLRRVLAFAELAGTNADA